MRSILIPMVDDDGNTPAAHVNRAKALVLTPFQTLPDGDMQSRESIAVGVNNWIRWERPGGLDVRVSLDVTGPRILIDGVTVFPGHAPATRLCDGPGPRTSATSHSASSRTLSTSGFFLRRSAI